MLRDLASEEDLLFLLSKSKRAKLGHSVLANHRSSDLGGLLDVVRSTCRNSSDKEFFGDTTAHRIGDHGLELFLRPAQNVLLGQEECHAKSTTARDDRHLV